MAPSANRSWIKSVCLLVFGLTALTATAQAPAELTPVMSANFKQAHNYSSTFLRQFVYSTSVEPRWIGKTDGFWYEYRTSKGKQWYRVDPRGATKLPLFDRSRLAASLSEEVRKPLDPLQLPISRATLSEDGVKFKFVTEDYQFEYDLRAEKLAKLGKAPRLQTGPGNMSPEQQQRLREMLGEERFKQLMEQQKEQQKEQKKDESVEEESLSEHDWRAIEEELRFLDDLVGLPAEFLPFVQGEGDSAQQKKFGGTKKGAFGPGGDYRNFSHDRKQFAFIKNHNLYLAEAGKEDQAIALTTNGAEDYTFTAGFGFGGQFQKDKDKKDDEKDLLKDGQEKDESVQLEKENKDAKPAKDRKTRAPVVWAKDSKAFYVLRRDSRGVKDLFLVNAVTEPRPALSTYKYPMPGEDNIRKTELHVCHMDKKKLVHVERRWRDESYSDLHWGKTSDELRFVRGDRLHRNIEFCTFAPAGGQAKCMILEGFENSSIVTMPVRYLDDSNEMVWWSERSGWGHFYLYDRAGKLKNPITAGDFRASNIAHVDAKNRLVYFRANGREPGENVYFNHLYRVHLDGTGLTLLDPGDGDHDSRLSPTQQFVVDNCSRVDQCPISVLRDANGKIIMELEKADLTKLFEVGWKMPQTFVVKAADGVTDLYGNLFKPFDFDPRKKYPVIAHVYPGPQTESMAHSFKTFSPQEQLAQLGFIVVQVGNRGGTPLRSKAYQSHSYWNLRDFGLSDKKCALEQLAARFPWMDLERVGIYGHSGGGFMSAAALLVKPYNDFFKVAVASAGNHDNNIYNNSWSERYHGMKEVPIPPEKLPKPTTVIKGTKIAGSPVDEDETKKEIITSKEQSKKKDDEVKEHTDGKKEEGKIPTRFEIKVPTNAELAPNLKGKLLLVHGDMDNNVHPANTIRLADALIKANKRFDMLIMPGKAHGFANYQPYFTQRMWEYFAEHLLDDRPTGTDLYERRERR